MKTGLESLDVGAPEITYSGNQGPKSPQEDQQKMQEFQMAQLEEEYDAYVDDMMEQGIEPMSMQQFLEQIAAEAQMSSNEQGGIGSMAGGENDRVRELLLLEETQGLSEEEKEELRALIKTISAQMPQNGMGDIPMEMNEGIGSMMQGPRTMAADGGFIMQGGVKNYLGKQETISDVPLKWQSGPDKPDTELAYITKAEKDLLLKKDIHGSLKDGPNMGPGGIMSLDSFGDIGGGQSGAQYDSGQGSGSQSQADSNAGNMGGGSQKYQDNQQAILDNAAKKEEEKFQAYLESEEAKKKAKAFAAAKARDEKARADGRKAAAETRKKKTDRKIFL
jgi:hypothetical protein